MVVKNGVETYRYYVTSSLGTTSLVLGEDGAILEESDTNPYGDIRYGTNDPNTTTYYGLHERNDTTGLVDMEARMYDPTNLQFSAPDPISLYSPNSFLSDPQQMHMYAYGRNNPVRYNDPTGQSSSLAWAIIPGITAVQSAVWLAGATALDSNASPLGHRPLTAELLRHSVSLNPKDVSYGPDSHMSQEIMKSAVFQRFMDNEIKEKIAYAEKNSITQINGITPGRSQDNPYKDGADTAFSSIDGSPDLHTAIGRSSIVANITKNKNGSWGGRRDGF